MDSSELRLECLRLAADRQLPAEDVVQQAQCFLDFVLKIGGERGPSRDLGHAQSADIRHTCPK